MPEANLILSALQKIDDRSLMNRHTAKIAIIVGGILILASGVLVWPSFSPGAVERSLSPQQTMSLKPSGQEPERAVVDPDEALMKESTPMVSAPPDFRFDGEVKEWRGVPPMLSLVKTNRRAARWMCAST
jgi:hypothetical protein